MQRPTEEFVNEHYPIVQARFYKNGIQPIRRQNGQVKRSRGRREFITEMSHSSLSRLAFSANNSRVSFSSMLCLSCGDIYPRDGILFKKAWNRTRSAMRYKFRPFEYLWFLEFQKRGAPHIHVMTNVQSVSSKDRQWLAEVWARSLLDHALVIKDYALEELEEEYKKLVRQHRRRQTWEKIKSKDGAARYTTKYALKPAQKEVPKDFARVGRFWGMSSEAKPKVLFTNDTTEAELRIHLAGKKHRMADVELLPKFIWGTE